MRRLTPIFLFAVLLVAFGIVAAQETPKPRTQYDSFDLSSPEAATRTFVDLFQNGDYAGLYTVFASETQTNWRRVTAVTFNYGYWVQSDQAQTIVTSVFDAFSEGETEQSLELINYVFHEIMVQAEAQDALLIDLRGDVTISGTEEAETVRRNEAVDVIAEVEGIEGEVRFRMVQSRGGRWRVFQVIPPGGDERNYPWAVVVPELTTP